MIPLPDPPLRAGDLLLRPWHLDDAAALVAAWADPEIQRWTGVPEDRGRSAVERWIAGDARRRRRHLSLDLVIDRGGAVAGEVGLSDLDRAAGSAAIGWWTAPAHRGAGVASRAAALLARWTEAALGLTPVARCDPANPASLAVARHAQVATSAGP